MYYYIASKKPKLEVKIAHHYSETDLQRIFLFIEALMDNPKMKVVFKVDPSLKEQFSKTIQNLNWHQFYAYNIK